VWREAADTFGIEQVWTMVRLGDAETVRGVLGNRVEFIAFPDFRGDRERAMTEGFLSDIPLFREKYGSRIVKLWNAPRLREYYNRADARDVVELDGAWRVRQVELAQQLGMAIMVHVGDPDTWFRTKYANEAVFGRKIDHYRGLRVMLDRFKGPWIAAHMGGWPEDLGFLSSMLTAHPNLYLDTSATKWMVRELSGHPREAVVEFFMRWRGRILFGSDIVTTDEHLAPAGTGKSHPKGDQADGPESAFDLYASRYWALRALLETDYEGESPIADPDLAMAESEKYDEMSAPMLRGLRLDGDVLYDLYRGTAEHLMSRIR
jgi:hypothetical protein